MDRARRARARARARAIARGERGASPRSRASWRGPCWRRRRRRWRCPRGTPVRTSRAPGTTTRGSPTWGRACSPCFSCRRGDLVPKTRKGWEILVSHPSREAKREGRPGPRARAEKVREEPGGRHARHRRRGTTPRARDAADRGAKRLGDPATTARPRKTGASVERSRSRRAGRTRGGSARGAPCSSLAALFRAMVADASCGASGEWRGARRGLSGRTQTVNYGVARRCFDLRKGNTQNQITLKTIRMSILGRLNRRFLGLDSRESETQSESRSFGRMRFRSSEEVLDMKEQLDEYGRSRLRRSVRPSPRWRRCSRASAPCAHARRPAARFTPGRPPRASRASRASRPRRTRRPRTRRRVVILGAASRASPPRTSSRSGASPRRSSSAWRSPAAASGKAGGFLAGGWATGA